MPTFRLFWISLLAGALLHGAAAASVYYVSPSGLATATGTSPAAPWSMAKANSSLLAGDVCMVLPGTYFTSITPVNAGTSLTNRITYVGNLANPAAATVPSIQPATSYVTIKGVAASGGINVSYPGVYDSVAYCVSNGLEFWAAKHSMVAHCTVNGSVAYLANNALPCYSSQNLDARCIANSEYDTLRATRVNIGEIVPGDRSFEFKAWTQHCLLDSNYVTGTFHDPGSTDTNNGMAVVSYNSYFQTFRYNRWIFESINNHHNFPDTHWDAFYFRDSTSSSSFQGDSIICGANSPAGTEIVIMMCGSGSFPGGVNNMTFTNSVIRTTGDIIWQNGFDRWTLDHCVIASRQGNSMYLLSPWTGSKLKNCTIWASGEALRMEGNTSGQNISGTGNEVTGNIFYSTNAGALGGGGGVVMWMKSTANFTANNNLYFSHTYTSSPGDLSIVYGAYTGSKPGTGQPWYNLNGQDGASKYGSPAFVDSTWSTFDPHLRTGSAAIGIGPSGVDAGAVSFTAGGADATPPAAVSNLAISNIASQSLLLGWTAPGDDANSGLATAYDLRVSTSAITSANFASATALVPQPTPLIAGTAQTYVATGLTAGTPYWFALKTRDEMGNWSTVSNVPTGTTLTSDTTAPAAIKDLSGH